MGDSLWGRYLAFENGDIIIYELFFFFKLVYHVCSSECEQQREANNLQNAAVATVTSHRCLPSSLLSWRAERRDCVCVGGGGALSGWSWRQKYTKKENTDPLFICSKISFSLFICYAHFINSSFFFFTIFQIIYSFISKLSIIFLNASWKKHHLIHAAVQSLNDSKIQRKRS